MILPSHRRQFAVLLCATALAASAHATGPNPADASMKQFLAQGDHLRPHRAVRWLEAENGDRKGWLEASTEYSPERGFRYEVTAEGGSAYIRSKVLRAVLDGEREMIVRGEAPRSALALANYRFQPDGVDADGLARVLLSPRRRERVLVSGALFLNATDGALVRLQGRLARSPSFWLKNVDIVRTYESINGIVVPVALDTRAQVRFVGDATFRMRYVYSDIDGQGVAD